MQARVRGRRQLADPADQAEYIMCSPRFGAGGFVRWLTRHAWVLDKDEGQEVRFIPFAGQQRVIGDLVLGRWLIILKGRQLGMTQLVTAYVLWRIVFAKQYLAMIVNQDKEYATDFIRRVRWLYDRLPAWSRPPIVTDNERTLRFEGQGYNAELRALVGKGGAGRSFTGDLAVFDEAAWIPDFAKTLEGVAPTLIRSARREHDGQIVVLTTSDGPEGDFSDLWRRTYGSHGETLDENGIGPNRFKPVFCRWSERPGRDAAWYAERKAELDAFSPVAIKREFPDTIEEAFQHAAGRVFPLFTAERNVGRIELERNVERYRAVDFGESKSAYVVLWLAYVPGPPGFLVSPDCPNTIREFLGYRLDERGLPADENDHAIDCVRYAVMKWSLRGLVYVYREIYRADSVAAGWNPYMEIEEIHQQSGWHRDPAGKGHLAWKPDRRSERYNGTVVDRSMGKMLNLFNASGIPAVPSPVIRAPKHDDSPHRDNPRFERLEGLRQVAALIDGSRDMDQYHAISREQAALQRVEAAAADRRRGIPAKAKLQDMMLAATARRMLGR